MVSSVAVLPVPPNTWLDVGVAVLPVLPTTWLDFDVAVSAVPPTTWLDVGVAVLPVHPTTWLNFDVAVSPVPPITWLDVDVAVLVGSPRCISVCVEVLPRSLWTIGVRDKRRPYLLLCTQGNDDKRLECPPRPSHVSQFGLSARSHLSLKEAFQFSYSTPCRFFSTRP